MASDPVYRPERACAGADQDVFFPSGVQGAAIGRAQDFCAGCEVLTECAAWAAPLVRAKKLTGCVVGGVYAPEHSRSSALHQAAADELAYVAATGALPPAAGQGAA